MDIFIFQIFLSFCYYLLVKTNVDNSNLKEKRNPSHVRIPQGPLDYELETGLPAVHFLVGASSEVSINLHPEKIRSLFLRLPRFFLLAWSDCGL
jgi:hypothetical protein